MKRREFISKTAAGSALIVGGMSLQSFKDPEKQTITILHTNDVHSHIDPFPADDPKYADLGGVARRAALIESIRAENPMLPRAVRPSRQPRHSGVSTRTTRVWGSSACGSGNTRAWRCEVK